MSELILEKNNELPDGWETSSIEVITKNHDGKRIPVSAELRKGMKGKYPYYGASGIIDYVEKPIFDGKFLLIGEDGANLVSRKTPIAFIAKGKFWVNNHAHVLTTLCNIPLEFLSYYINNINLTPWISGTAQPKLNQTNMNKISVLLPPLNEQKRIVQKIESIFSQIDAGKENLEVLASHVKSSSGSLNVLKASVLKQAFEGRLVPQDHNDESAEILLKKIHGDSKIEFKGENLLKGWVITNINKVCITKSGGTPSRKNSEYFGGTIPWIKSGELNDSIITSCEESITKLGLEQSNASLYPKNTILMAMYGATIGKLAILGFSASTNQAICALSHNEKILIDMYLFLFLKSIRNDLIGIGFGGAQKNISQEKIKNILIPIPPLPEQRRIVSKIESIFDKIDAIEKHVDDSLIKLESLKKSVLKKAFEGNLVPQDPNDEPASVLLERIKQEKLLIRKK